jgi:hypothetical protein
MLSFSRRSNVVLIGEPIILKYRREMTDRCVKETEDFINVFHTLPLHVSASGCHLQGVVAAL